MPDHAGDEKPWVLFLGIALPPPPNLIPEQYFGLYQKQAMPMPPQWRIEDWPTHPGIDHTRRFFNFTEQIGEQEIRNFLVAYYGACSYIDDKIGKLLKTLEQCNLNRSTRVLYSSDHGEGLGARGIFGKFSMYEESIAVPFIMAGTQIPAGDVVNTPISLVDCYPTILDALGIALADSEADLPGSSVWQVIQKPDPQRTIFAEYHGLGSINGIYMLRNERYKYIYHVHADPQLFDLIDDPGETRDLCASEDHRSVVQKFESELRSLLDPEAVDAQAKEAQNRRILAAGGKDAIRKKGTFDNSPIPGEKAVFFKRG